MQSNHLSETPATPEQIATLTFDAVEMEDAIPSREKWMESAGNSYPIVRMALEILTRNDKELTEIAAAEAGALLKLHEQIGESLGYYTAVLEALNSAEARLMIALARVVEVRSSNAA